MSSIWIVLEAGNKIICGKQPINFFSPPLNAETQIFKWLCEAATLFCFCNVGTAFGATCQIGFGEFGSGSVFDHGGNTIPHLPLQRAEIDHLVEL